MDLIMGGNNYEFKPQYSRLDANYGTVLLNDGTAQFGWADYDMSGYFVKDEVKHMAQIKDKNGTLFLVTAINNQKPKIHKLGE